MSNSYHQQISHFLKKWDANEHSNVEYITHYNRITGVSTTRTVVKPIVKVTSTAAGKTVEPVPASPLNPVTHVAPTIAAKPVIKQDAHHPAAFGSLTLTDIEKIKKEAVARAAAFAAKRNQS